MLQGNAPTSTRRDKRWPFATAGSGAEGGHELIGVFVKVASGRTSESKLLDQGGRGSRLQGERLRSSKLLGRFGPSWKASWAKSCSDTGNGHHCPSTVSVECARARLFT
jgi:hypothetical protein